jgi:hypothetical protein
VVRLVIVISDSEALDSLSRMFGYEMSTKLHVCDKLCVATNVSRKLSAWTTAGE